MKREKRVGRSLGRRRNSQFGITGGWGWQEGLKRRDVSRPSVEARALGGRGTQAMQTQDSSDSSRAFAGRASSAPARTRSSTARARGSPAGSQLVAASAGRGGKSCAHA